jgi:hypothetical protein
MKLESAILAPRRFWIQGLNWEGFGVSQDNLYQELGVSYATVTRRENGKPSRPR